MRENSKPRLINRRVFMKDSINAAGFFGAMVGTQPWSLASERLQAADTNPYAYDVTRLAKTDPKWVHYHEINRFRSPHEIAQRLAIGPDDTLFVAAGQFLSALDLKGGTRFEAALASPPRCLAVSREGDIYVGLRDHIEVFSPKGQRRAAWESPNARTWFTSIAATSQGVFAADAGNRVVLQYNSSGQVIGRIGEKNKARNIPGFIVPSPFFDVEMHADGLLRIANPGRHRVEVYTVAGDFEFAWGKPSAAIDGFCGCCNPINLALLPNKRLVTCEKGLPRVKVYRDDGTLESVVAGPESFPENRGPSTPSESLSDCTHGGLDAAVDSSGRIYILDLVTANIRVMERNADIPNPVSAKPSSPG